MATIRQKIRIRTGTQGNGNPDYLELGFITEEKFKGDNVRRRTWIHTSVLNPVLFAQVRPFLNGASYVCLNPVDLPRGLPGPDVPNDDHPPTSEAAPEEQAG